MCARRASENDQQLSQQFVALLNHLFETPRAHGRPYTLTEVSRATGLSVPYLSLLRKGAIGNVSLQRVVVLARFFHVSLDYFCPRETPVEPLDNDVQEALAQPLVRELALRAARMSLGQRALVLALLHHVAQMQGESAALLAAPARAYP